MPGQNERRPVAHPDYTLEASDLARLISADLAELPSEVLAKYVAPKARQAMRELDAVVASKRKCGTPVPPEIAKVERFWRRLDAYCEAEVRERAEAMA